MSLLIDSTSDGEFLQKGIATKKTTLAGVTLRQRRIRADSLIDAGLVQQPCAVYISREQYLVVSKDMQICKPDTAKALIFSIDICANAGDVNNRMPVRMATELNIPLLQLFHQIVGRPHRQCHDRERGVLASA